MNCKSIGVFNLDRKKYIEDYYKPNIGKEIPDFMILGWESKEAQHLRFEALMTNVELEHKKLLDVGCGLGNLLEYLNDRGVKVEYSGVDILEDMIGKVKRKSLPGRFYCMDIFNKHHFKRESFDVVYTSGIFNLNLNNNMDFLKRALGCFLDLSKDIVVFNLLDKNSSDKEDRYYYYDSEDVVAMITKQYSQLGSIEVISGYLNNDFTVICRKN